MKHLPFCLLAVIAILSTSASAQVIENENFVPDMSFEQTMNAIRMIKPGISLYDATAALQNAGFKKHGAEAGGVSSWNSYFRLSKSYRLVLQCTSTSGKSDRMLFGRVAKTWVETEDCIRIFDLANSAYDKKAEPSVPGYPPQSVGSPEP